jgi:phage protein D
VTSPERVELALFRVKLEGSDAPPALFDVLAELQVDQSLHMPAMFTLRIVQHVNVSPSWEWADDARFSVGKAISVLVKQGAADVQLVEGEITSIELDIEREAAPMLVIRGYDKSHRLHRGTRTRAFLKQTDSQIAQKVAGECGLSFQATSTSVQHEHVFQANTTDWDFLSDRARRNGFVLRFDAGKLKFEKPEAISGGTVTLKLGESLLEFHPRHAATPQVNSVEVRGWDPVAKQPAVASVTAPSWSPTATGLPTGRAAGQQGFASAAKLMVTEQAVANTGLAQALAGAALKAISSVDLSGDGACLGNANVKPGATLTVQGIGTRFSGTYYVTSARHTYTPEDGYITEFTVGGMSSGTLASLLLSDPRKRGQQANSAPPWNLAVGIVTNNNDEETGGRVKLKFPWLSDDLESAWAPLASPMAGPGTGLIILPEVNDEVIVGFLDGDFNSPYVLGSTWNGKDKMPMTVNKLVEGGKVVRRHFRTPAGHVLTFDESSSSAKIELVDKSGSNKIVIDTQSKKIDIESGGDINITATGKINIDAKGEAKIKAPNISVEAQAKLELKGAQIAIAGTAQVKISAPMVQIN